MNLPDVLEIIDDPELGGGVAFQVKRTVTRRVIGNVEHDTLLINATGNIQPQTKSTQASTLEDPLSESIVIYTTFIFQTGENHGGASFTARDEVIWNGHTWRLTSVNNWEKWGFTIAYAERVRG
ncbi:MAG: hypothetical protein J6Y48_06740 [Clostridia bacterium]|nr:hypothetical protein [Clostridia bacterium]